MRATRDKHPVRAHTPTHNASRSHQFTLDCYRCLHDQPEEPPQAPPLPECAPLPNHTQHACGRCGPVFARPCADSSTVFGDAAAPAAGVAQDGNRVETQFLTLCEQCCGCSEWNGGAYLVEDPNVRRLGVFQVCDAYAWPVHGQAACCGNTVHGGWRVCGCGYRR